MTTIYINMRESFDDEQLITEMKGRGYVVRHRDEEDDVTRIYEALYLGKQEEAMQRTREYVCNVLGRVL